MCNIRNLLHLLILPVVQATINLNLPQLEYIANHLKPDECRQLIASLHLTEYDLPPSYKNAIADVPKDIPCIKLLVKWNSGIELWEGHGKSHQDVEHRLRQLGKTDLADWLGKTVFHQLAKDINDSLLNNQFGAGSMTTASNKFGAKNIPICGVWTVSRSILMFWLCFLLTLVLYYCFLKIYKIFRKTSSVVKTHDEEMKFLLKTSDDDDDDEVIYENEAVDYCDRKTKRKSSVY